MLALALALALCTLSARRSSAAEQAALNDKPYFTDVGQMNYAMFLMGEEEYDLAAREFSRLIEDFPASPLLPRAQYGMAEAYYRSDRLRDAEAELKLFLRNFEDSPFATGARLRLDEVQKKLGRNLNPEEPSPGIYTTPPGEHTPGLRAVQVMLFEGKTYGEVDSELKRLKRAGVDTVIVRVFHNRADRYYPFVKSSLKSGVYFKTSHAPVVADILGPVAALAHADGLKIFAWMTTRYANYGVEEDKDMACKGYDLDKRAMVRCKGLDLFNDRAVARLEGLYSDLAGYDIDGVLFQDDLMLRHTEGFGPYMERLFAKENGRGLNPEALYIRNSEGEGVHYTKLFWKWASFKNRRLLSVAKQLRETVRKKRPGAKFAINMMYESVTNPPYALAWLSQSLDAAVAANFDYYSIMAYQKQMEEELGKSPGDVRAMIGRMVTDASGMVKDPGSVLIKLQTIDWQTGRPLANRDVVSLLRKVKGMGDVSLAVVPYRGDFPFYELGGAGLASLN